MAAPMAALMEENNTTKPLLEPSTPPQPTTDGGERTTSSSTWTAHFLPSSPLSKTISPLILVAIAFQVVHFALATASLCTDWSRTIVHFDEEEGSIVHPEDDTLYPSDFWTNVRNFQNSGATPLAVLLCFTGVGQPLIKFMSMGLLSKRALFPLSPPPLSPTTPSSRFSYLTLSPHLSLVMLETFGKMTMVASNVGVTLLTAVTITFHIDGGIIRKPFDADAITDTLVGTEMCMLATLAACFATALLRDENTRSAQQKGRMSYLHNPHAVSRDTSHASSSISTASPVGYTRIASLTSTRTEALGIMTTLQPAVMVLMVLFVIPAFSLDIVKFNYTGFGADFLKDGKTSIRVKVLTFGDNLVTDTPSAFYGAINIISFYINNVVCPVIAVAGAVLIRMKKATPGIIRMTRWAFTFSMLDAVVIAILFVAPEVSMISKWIFDDSISICTTLEQDTDDDCLVISGSILTGGYFLILSALCFDVFLISTLWGVDMIEKEKLIMRDEVHQIIKQRNANAIMEGTEGEEGVEDARLGLDVRIPDNV
mmetsp:Transcript_10383/g.21380  ORF Transcript_10383/g.21380 Transcript_10383/m.21380 type:complete len:540 (+) Transcript_10383:161-1780(+)